MPPALSSLEHLSRYAALLRSIVAKTTPFIPEMESAGSIQVERAVAYPLALIGSFERNSKELLEKNPPLDRIVDRQGHSRPMYGPLLLYSLIQAQRIESTTGQATYHGWEKTVEEYLARAPVAHEPSQSFLAADGPSIITAAWNTVVQTAGSLLPDRPSWRTETYAFFENLCAHQRANGAFLKTNPHDNPETHWYHELVILHAAATVAALTRNTALLAAVGRNANFHLNETQPDHATTQPWGVLAFVLTPEASPLADDLLHATMTQHPAGLQGLPMVLLADALYCLELLILDPWNL